jgi:hypothetical protein
LRTHLLTLGHARRGAHLIAVGDALDAVLANLLATVGTLSLESLLTLSTLGLNALGALRALPLLPLLTVRTLNLRTFLTFDPSRTLGLALNALSLTIDALHLRAFDPLGSLLLTVSPRLSAIAAALRLRFGLTVVLIVTLATGRGRDRQGGDTRGEEYPGH